MSTGHRILNDEAEGLDSASDVPEPARPRARGAGEEPLLPVYDLCDVSSPNAMYAALVREGRRAAGLSKADLGARVGVPSHVVALWEDASYEGHDLALLRRVARALGTRLELRLAPGQLRRASA